MPFGRSETIGAAVLKCAAALCCAGVAVLCGCVSAEPPVRSIDDRQPAWVAPTRVLLAIQLPEDRDGNGYLDTIGTSVYLFDERYPLAVAVPGSFVFTLTTREGALIGAWEMSEAETAAAVRRLRPGPGYQFLLDVRKFGSDQRDSQPVELVVEFVPKSPGPAGPDGAPAKPVRGSSATSLRLGRSGV